MLNHGDEMHELPSNDQPTSINKNHAQRIDRLVSEYESNILKQLNAQYTSQTTKADRLADKIAAFGGSWKFIIAFASFLFLWLLWNTISLTAIAHFDSPPFILLNLILSFIAAFQAPIIMMSQNRQAARDKHEALIDFSINYKAELEIDDMQSHLHRIEKQVAEIRQVLLVLQKEGPEKTKLPRKH